MQTPFCFFIPEENMKILLNTVIDNLKLFPFLFITYLFLEYLEHKTSDKAEQYIR